MEIAAVGVVGLGRMGLAIAERLVQAGFKVYGVDPDATKKDAVEALGIVFVSSCAELATKVRIVWLMVPAGEPVDIVLREMVDHLAPGSVVIDGGNSFFKDTLRRAESLIAKNLWLLDCGTSGGLHGRELGYCLMVGGPASVVQHCQPLFDTVAMQPGGFAHVGPVGAGHYVKMVHNGIEYAVLQAYGEGLHLLKEGVYHDLDLAQITALWQHGSIIRSWIGDLAHKVLEKDQALHEISGTIGENKTGQWTVELAKGCGIELPVIEKSLAVRAWSRTTGGNYATKIVAMLRHAFGGHPVEKR
jgi:6-phosphogluconate dehydrogenase